MIVWYCIGDNGASDRWSYKACIYDLFSGYYVIIIQRSVGTHKFYRNLRYKSIQQNAVCYYPIRSWGDSMYSRLRDLREDRDLKQRELADYLNCSQQVYSNYELGQRDIPTDILIKLSGLYHVSIDYILGITDNPKQYTWSIQKPRARLRHGIVGGQTRSCVFIDKSCFFLYDTIARKGKVLPYIR